MRKIYTGILFLLTILPFFGQSKSQLKADKDSRPFANSNITDYSEEVLNIQFHIIRSTMGLGGATKADVTRLHTVLNQYFKQARIQFVNCGAHKYLDNSNLKTYKGEEEPLLRVNNVPNAINIYLVDFIDEYNDGYNVAGLASHPLVGAQTTIVVNYHAALKGSNTLAHEMGHCLGLFHTHEEDYGKGLVNNTNCKTTGDLLCDTPADPKMLPRLFDENDIPRVQKSPYWNYYNDKFPKNSNQNGVFVPNPAASASGFFAVGKCSINELSVDLFNNPSTPSKCDQASEWKFYPYTVQNELEVLTGIINSGLYSTDHLYDFGNPNIYWQCGEAVLTDPQIICTDRPANQQPPYPKLTNYGGCRPCEYFGVEIDPNGQRYSPPHYNVMSYGSSNYDYLTSCAKIFTNDQSVEMHYWINHVNRSYAKGSVYNLFDRRLTTNLTLNSHHRYVVQNVVVNNNSKLDIDHCLETNIKYNFEVPLGSTLEIR